MTDENVIKLPVLAALEREAAAWLVRLDSADLDDSDQLAFQAWLSTSVQHRDAFERMSEFWGQSESLRRLQDYVHADDMTELLSLNSKWRMQSSSFWAAGSAIAATIALFFGMSALQAPTIAEPIYVEQFVTNVGEQRTITLPDKSTVILNTDSVINVVIEPDSRNINLARGEAFFDVVSDPNSPFSVATKSGTVTAVGTAFSVRVHEDRIGVLVSEGRVKVTPTPLPTRTNKIGINDPMITTEVSAGQSLEFEESPKVIEVVDDTKLKKALDWQDGIIAFNGQELEQVIRDLDRYTDIEITIADNDLKLKKVVAYYRVGEIEPVLEALDALDGVRVDWESDKIVRLHSEN